MSSQFHQRDEGFETTYASQVLSLHILTARLLPALQRGTRSRVIVVPSGGMDAEKVDPGEPADVGCRLAGVRAYARAKQAQEVVTEQWARRSPQASVGLHRMQPSWADTRGVQESLPTLRRLTRPILRTAQEGAETIVWLAGVLGPPPERLLLA
jgi:dehydrogenase/reductase SDR family member 12